MLWLNFFGNGFSSTRFSLWGLIHAGTNPHKLMPAL